MSCSKTESEVLVVGAGVSGLTSGIELLRAGFSVEIIAALESPNTTSDKAAAFWLPFLSNVTDDFMIWSQIAYNEWLSIAKSNSSSGVLTKQLNYLIPANMSISVPWWASFVNNFTFVNSSQYFIPNYSAFLLQTALIQTDLVMKWLENQYTSLGGVIIQQNISDLYSLLDKYDIVINCAGLSSFYLANDSDMHPIRGQIVIVETPSNGLNFNNEAVSLNEKHSSPFNFDEENIFIDELTPNKLAYIVPRWNGVLLGGTQQMDDWNDQSDPNDVQAILTNTAALNPSLKGASILRTYAGLRPYRSSGVRLEQEKSSKVPAGKVLIHNYGHGGSGWTVSWGCAQQVTKLVQIAIQFNSFNID